MTLAQRRRRLLAGIAICGATVGGLVIAAILGIDRHITFVSSMGLWPALAILTGQWSRVRVAIAKSGPDYPERHEPLSRKTVAAGFLTILIIFAVGAFLALQIPSRT